MTNSVQKLYPALYVYVTAFSALFFMGLLISGCGGGGARGEQLPAKILTWEPPSSYSDDSPLDPTSELESFEIYVKEDGYFTESENGMASISAINRGTGQVTTSFNLANLSSKISKGVYYYVSVRAIAKNGLKSAFSSSAMFSY